MAGRINDMRNKLFEALEQRGDYISHHYIYIVMIDNADDDVMTRQ